MLVIVLIRMDITTAFFGANYPPKSWKGLDPGLIFDNKTEAYSSGAPYSASLKGFLA
jgi:hypothetical protein